jgi:hypothetical protein
MSRPSSFGSIDERFLEWNSPESIEKAKRDGKQDGTRKSRMSPQYMDMIRTDEDSIGKAYASAYKDAREEAYRKTGSNRRRKTKSLRKTRRAKKLNGRK